MASIAKFDQWQDSAGNKFGTVVQVVQQTYDAQVSTNTLNTLVDGPGTVTITPKSASNKILIMLCFSTLADVGANVDAVCESHNILYRGTTLIGPASGWKQSITRTSGWNNIAIQHLDSPATTSSVTYKMQFRRVSAASGTVYVNTGESGGNFRWTLLEIQA